MGKASENKAIAHETRMKDNPMTTTPEAVEAALRFADARHLRLRDETFTEYLNILRECRPHLGQPDVDGATIRILDARVRELERYNVQISDLEHLRDTWRNHAKQYEGPSRLAIESCTMDLDRLIDTAQHPQPERAKQVDEVLYGLEGQELLDKDVETIISHLLHTNCEKPGESFDVVADRIQWPVKVLEFRRMNVSDAEKNSLAASTLESVIESLDEDHAGPDGTSNKPTAPMQLAARRFVDEVVRHYVVWSCEPTGEVIEITREQAKEIVG